MRRDLGLSDEEISAPLRDLPGQPGQVVPKGNRAPRFFVHHAFVEMKVVSYHHPMENATL